MLTEVNVDLRKEEKGMKKQRKREREEGRRKRGREGGKSDRGRRKKGIFTSQDPNFQDLIRPAYLYKQWKVKNKTLSSLTNIPEV